MDIVIFGVVCAAAFLIIPSLWWSRELRAVKRSAIAGQKAPKREGFARKPALAS